VSYQAEERYWTDYLRIALPIAGLLLLLGVFWYWASSFIGDDTESPNTTPEVAVATTPITADTPTPTTTTAVTIAVTTAEPTQETQAPPEATNPPSQPEPTATTEPEDPGNGSTGGFTEGDLVVVNDIEVNIRSDASTGADVITQVNSGDELTILSAESVDDGEYIWWNVETLEGDQGWIAGIFIEASPS
jgi:uncharacterized protein YgiM (DUF1202 family)